MKACASAYEQYPCWIQYQSSKVLSYTLKQDPVRQEWCESSRYTIHLDPGIHDPRYERKAYRLHHLEVLKAKSGLQHNHYQPYQRRASSNDHRRTTSAAVDWCSSFEAEH